MNESIGGKKTFSVQKIGILDSETKVLQNIFKLSLYRTRSYRLNESAADGVPDIILFDPQGANAETALHDVQTLHPGLPIVLVTQDPPSPARPHCIRRPFVASRVLAVLDHVAVSAPRPPTEAVIGAEPGASKSIGDRAAAAVAQIAEAAEKHAAAQPVVNTQKVLVVDDSLPVRKQMEIALRQLGVHADFAENGDQAFQLLDAASYDLVFLDVVLPGVDGYRICKTIKKNTGTKNTPVVMLTSKSSPFDRVRGTFAGCDTYLTKPLAQESFQKVVQKYLGAVA